jgi:hypothetical protein
VYAVRDLREQLAEVSGDLEHYVAVLAENLTSAIQYERIVHGLRDADRRQDAITWAWRGLADKPGWPHADQLRDTLVAMLLAEGKPEDAVKVRREEFARHPTLTTFRAQADHRDGAGRMAAAIAATNASTFSRVTPGMHSRWQQPSWSR